ncbi:hypothetical protein ACC796_36760, partial [Rhizobium ruizarguesonis]
LSLTVLIVIRHAIENDLPLMPQSRSLWLATATGLAICITGGMQSGSHGLRQIDRKIYRSENIKDLSRCGLTGQCHGGCA